MFKYEWGLVILAVLYYIIFIVVIEHGQHQQSIYGTKTTIENKKENKLNSYISLGDLS